MKSLRSKTLKTCLRLSRFLAAPVTKDNLEQKRRAYTKLKRFFPVARTVKIETVSTSDFVAEWITVPESRQGKVLLYMPGGGFVFRSGIHRDLISRVAREAEVRALALSYSLAPEHPFPVALNEAIYAYKWLLAQGIKTKDIAVAGDSAGGALVLSLLHQLKREKLRKPACAIVIAPATDATLGSPSIQENQSKDFFIKLSTLEFFIESYFQDTPTDDPVASPLHGSLKGFPPLLIHIDKDEIMHGDSAMLYEKANKEGVEVELYETQGLWHVWHLFARYIPEAREAIRHIGAFIRKYV